MEPRPTRTLCSSEHINCHAFEDCPSSQARQFSIYFILFLIDFGVLILTITFGQGGVMTEVQGSKEMQRYLLELQRVRSVEDLCTSAGWDGRHYDRKMIEEISSKPTWKRLTAEINALN